MFYWLMKNVVAGPWLRLLFRPWVVDAQNVPDDGPVILASNHLSVLDSFVLPIVLRRKVVFIGKSEYFTGKGLRGKIVAGFMKGVGTIPVDRSGGRASEAALHTGLEHLKSGGVFGIYPEGTRSPDGRLYRGKTGIARLAIESGATVVPVAMIGTDKSQPIGKRLPRPMRIGVVFGAPLRFDQYQGAESDRFVLRSVTDDVLYGIQLASGQEYVDVYAATQKSRSAAGKLAATEGPSGTGAPGGRPRPDGLEVPQPPS